MTLWVDYTLWASSYTSLQSIFCLILKEVLNNHYRVYFPIPRTDRRETELASKRQFSLVLSRQSGGLPKVKVSRTWNLNTYYLTINDIISLDCVLLLCNHIGSHPLFLHPLSFYIRLRLSPVVWCVRLIGKRIGVTDFQKHCTLISDQSLCWRKEILMRHCPSFCRERVCKPLDSYCLRVGSRERESFEWTF